MSTETTATEAPRDWVSAFETWERFIFDTWETRSGFPDIREIFRAGWEAHEVISNEH